MSLTCQESTMDRGNLIRGYDLALDFHLFISFNRLIQFRVADGGWRQFQLSLVTLTWAAQRQTRQTTIYTSS